MKANFGILLKWAEYGFFSYEYYLISELNRIFFTRD